MLNAYIFDHIRTPRGRGKASGALHEITPIDLAAQVLATIKERNGLEPSAIDDVALGVVCNTGEQGGGVPRAAAIDAGFGDGVPGIQINRFCSSALDAVNLSAAHVSAGQVNLMIAGGVESMSRVPAGSDVGGWRADPHLINTIQNPPVGVAADLLATLGGYKREDIDSYALASQQRASTAWNEGRFSNSVVAVTDQIGRVVLEADETVRHGAKLEDLSRLRPAFEKMGQAMGFDELLIQKYPELEAINHVHTAASSSGIVDGASVVLVGDLEFGKSLGLKPRARIRSFASVGDNVALNLAGPAPATRKALDKAGMSVADIDLFEVNEAFASVVLRYMDELGVCHSKVNVNGGAIAMGHPTGATGAMLLGTVLDELERTGKQTAVISLCVALGMGTATVIERV